MERMSRAILELAEDRRHAQGVVAGVGGEYLYGATE